jgi:hypothetical protein
MVEPMAQSSLPGEIPSGEVELPKVTDIPNEEKICPREHDWVKKKRVAMKIFGPELTNHTRFGTSHLLDHVACPAFNKRIPSQICKLGIVHGPTNPPKMHICMDCKMLAIIDRTHNWKNIACPLLRIYNNDLVPTAETGDELYPPKY